MKCAEASQVRAIAALAAPVLAWSLAIVAMHVRGYSVFDYPHLISSGQLSWFTQGMGWLGTAGWITWFWPSAVSAVKEGSLVIEEGDSIRLPTSGATFKKSDVEIVKYQDLIYARRLFFKLKDGRTETQAAFFLKSNGWDAATAIGERLANCD